MVKGANNRTGSGSPSLGDLSSFIARQSVSSGYVNAYINWVLFDEQLRIVSTSSWNVQGAESINSLPAIAVNVVKNGYLYVYCSNTSNQDVFFDNLQVIHNRGVLTEEEHYYAFGLTMKGISSQAAGGLENKYKFNKGSELQHQEFSDGSGLDLYETRYRSLDPQIGKFWQIDPLANMNYELSSYLYANNNPILINDPSGLISDSTDKKGNVWHGLNDVAVTSHKKQPATQVLIWSKAGGKDVGHTAIRLGDVVYGFYPTSTDPNAAGYGLKDLVFPGSPGNLHVDSIANFNKLYAGQEVTYYQLNLTPEQIKKLTKILNEITKNPGYYNLLHNQCTSVAINTLINSGVKIYGQYNDSPYPNPMLMGNGNLVSPSDLQSILQSPYNKVLISRIVKFIVGQ